MLMYTILIPSLLYIALTIASSELLNSIQGTWQSQSERVITGPTFFDPQKELLEEPKLPGISYSFKNGYWESAQYIVMGNNRNHQCPQAMLIWQHGKYNLKGGKLVLIPNRNDGRQLISDPCLDNGKSEYKRFHNGETLEVDIRFDGYFGNWKLVLVDYLTGKKKQPMWLTSRNATMLPTGTITSTKRKYVKKE
ncbi:hypothetical protein W5Q_03524 [Candida albicans SC5314]|nr:hypothetical protein MEU_03461 [Candida albicans P37005]KHC53202.1 hypothetical protein MGC_03466 [Candida albicans P37039]KHC77526.1 hypothetical protein W5Q_03524 [Candida albicans SC5314]